MFNKSRCTARLSCYALWASYALWVLKLEMWLYMFNVCWFEHCPKQGFGNGYWQILAGLSHTSRTIYPELKYKLFVLTSIFLNSIVVFDNAVPLFHQYLRQANFIPLWLCCSTHVSKVPENFLSSPSQHSLACFRVYRNIPGAWDLYAVRSILNSQPRFSITFEAWRRHIF